ncbi:MAG: hypothetical protein IPM33_10350 [Phycisphaerales bacterium]|nr:hypothetical protein [Phycisphaerales bacterium]
MRHGTNEPAHPVRRPANRPPSQIAPLALLVVWYAASMIFAGWVSQQRGEPVIAWAALLLGLFLGPVALTLLVTAKDGARVMEAKVDELTRAVRAIQDQSALSDDARRIINRRQEREVLCQAIEEDIASGNFDAARTLIGELADRCGYRTDAEEFRRRIDQTRAQTVEEEITDAIASLDGLIMQRRFDQAETAAARLGRLYPDSPRTASLRARVEQARESCKAELERRFLVASHEGRVEDALSTLKELDAYLSPNEAEPLRELARGVIGRARENLGAEFKIAVQDRRWKDASGIGERIIAEFPNTRMATEVRQMIDAIRTRARELA